MNVLRISTLLIVMAAAGAGSLLFWTSQSVQQKEDALRDMRQAVAKEKQAIRVLNAEWDYLNRPDRLDTLSSAYLKLVPPVAQQASMTPADLPEPFVPVLPPQKPDRLKPLPAALSTPAAAPQPGTKPSRPAQASSSRSFQSLMKDLTDEEKVRDE